MPAALVYITWTIRLLLPAMFAATGVVVYHGYLAPSNPFDHSAFFDEHFAWPSPPPAGRSPVKGWEDELNDMLHPTVDHHPPNLNISITVQQADGTSAQRNNASALLLYTSDEQVIALNHSNANIEYVFEGVESDWRMAPPEPEIWSRTVLYILSLVRFLGEVLLHLLFPLIQVTLDMRGLSFSAWIERLTRARAQPLNPEYFQLLMAESIREPVEMAVRLDNERRSAIASKFDLFKQ